MEQSKQITEQKSVISNDDKIVKNHCPSFGASQIEVERLQSNNSDYYNLLPLLLQSSDHKTVAALVTTSLCFKWLYGVRRPMYEVGDKGELKRVEKENEGCVK